MAICKNCGKEYDPFDVRQMIWGICGIFSKRLMTGLCYSCAIEAYEDETGEDPEEMIENMSEKEFEEHIKDSVDLRMDIESDYFEF